MKQNGQADSEVPGGSDDTVHTYRHKRDVKRQFFVSDFDSKHNSSGYCI